MFRKISRVAMKAAKNLGVIEIELPKNGSMYYRDPKLELYDSYYENRQYESLPEWEKEQDNSGDFVAVRKRQPRIKYPMAKTLADRLVSKFIGGSKFPTFKIDDSPDDQTFIAAVIRESQIKSRLLEPFKRAISAGSCFIRFYLVDGVMKVEWFCSKYCYPKFQPNGELESVEIRYVYTDKEEKDERGNYKKKWFKMVLETTKEIMFDNPEYDPNAESLPIFTEVDSVEHGLGFVQGTWLKTSESRDSIDGYAFVSDIMDFIDEICYSLSQSSQAIGYNQDPQLILNGMDEEEIATLIRSATKSWNLGKEGKAEYLETALTGAQVAAEMRTDVKQNVQDFSRILLLDPEKIIGSAQSAKAMETLYAPMVELIEELRGVFEPQLKATIIKMALIILIATKQGIETPIEMPAGYQPKSLELDCKWQPVFQQTIEDLQKKVNLAAAATAGNLISRETGTRFLAEDFPIPDGDIDAELARIAAQPVLNPFGGGF